jgi:hypothetical protein
VVFIEMKDVVKQEVLPSKEEPEKIEEQESEVEDPHTPVLRISVRERRLLERYTLSDFC